jgi:hypothetical protein
VFPVRYDLGFYIPEDGNLVVSAVETSHLAYANIAILRDITPCDSCKNRCFGGTCSLHHQSDKTQPIKKHVYFKFNLKW